MEIELKGICKRFGKKQILRRVDLRASGGQCIGILGANGSGKSTLLSVLAGVLKADGGSFTLDGRELFTAQKLRAARVGYVPQGTPLLEELTGRDNLRLWYSKEGLQRSLQDGVLKVLAVEDFLGTRVSRMSGGMKKRLSIGCAMAGRPPVLLLDEPTAALDLVCKAQIADYLRQYKAQGGILLLTTHDASELTLCDAWYILKDGVLEPFTYGGDLAALTERLV